MPRYACDACGSAAIEPPTDLVDDAPVHCAACRAPRGTWGELRDAAARLIAQEQRRPSPVLSYLSADPLPPVLPA